MLKRFSSLFTPFLSFIFFERFSYYGILSLLVLYLSSKLNFTDAKSYATFGVYGTLTYATPLIEGYIGLKVGWFYGFSLAGLAGIGALSTLYASRKFKREIHSEHSIESKIPWKKMVVILGGGGISAILLSFVIYYGEETLDLFLGLSVIYLLIYLKHFFAVPKDQRFNMLIIFFGIMAVALSGALIGHGDTVFTLLMKRNVDPTLLTFEVPITFIQAIDPLTIVIIGPFFALLWKLLSKKGSIFQAS